MSILWWVKKENVAQLPDPELGFHCCKRCTETGNNLLNEINWKIGEMKMQQKIVFYSSQYKYSSHVSRQQTCCTADINVTVESTCHCLHRHQTMIN